MARHAFRRRHPYIGRNIGRRLIRWSRSSRDEIMPERLKPKSTSTNRILGEYGGPRESKPRAEFGAQVRLPSGSHGFVATRAAAPALVPRILGGYLGL